eukprot:GGOE01006341.1.p1 GENE.GGOE01006341.1~~GGOE01006341.1.p1  ORF type:complete len:294 (-),score=67.41 GGOE01006341.1:1154-2008(-)
MAKNDAGEVAADLQRDIHEQMLQKERRQPYQPHMIGPYVTNYRVLVAHCIGVCDAFDLSEVTIFRACQLMNRAFTCPHIDQEVQKPNFQLVLLVCIAVAAKFEEADLHLHVPNLLEVANGQYEMEDFAGAERFLLDYLQWEISDVTPACFVGFYLSHSATGDPAVDNDVETTVTRLLGLSLYDYSFCHYLPSILSAAALKLARWVVQERLCLSPEALGWGPEMVALTHYSSEDLRQCCSHLWQSFRGSFGGVSPPHWNAHASWLGAPGRGALNQAEPQVLASAC